MSACTVYLAGRLAAGEVRHGAELHPRDLVVELLVLAVLADGAAHTQSNLIQPSLLPYPLSHPRQLAPNLEHRKNKNCKIEYLRSEKFFFPT